MFRHKDGRRNGSGKAQDVRGEGRAMLCAACLFALWSGPAWAQEAGAAASVDNSAGKLEARIERIEATPGEKIELLTGRSVLLEVNRDLRQVAVGDPRVVEVTTLSPRQYLIMAQGVGSTSLVLWDGNQQKVTYEIVVQLDLTQLRTAINELAPGSAVEVRALGDKIVLRGTVADVDTLEKIVQLAQVAMSSSTASKSGGSSASPAVQNTGATTKADLSSNIVNLLKVAGEHQVVLRCTVAEVSKTAIRQLGINGWLGGDNFHDVFAVNQIGMINPVNIGAANFGPIGGAHAAAIPFALANGGLSPATEFTLGFPRVQMQLFFNALRDNRLLRVLAEPNLVALSGQEASFLAGGEFPFLVPQSLGTVTIEWKNFGIQLRFTPSVIGQQQIRLRVAPEVSDLDFTNGVTLNGVIVPALTSRRTETTIELASGSTIAIAGLLSERVRGATQKLPALGDVPVLGALFSSVSYQKDQTELVILVTPEIVSSLQPDQVDPVPGQHMRDPNDWELMGLGLLEGKPTCEESNPAKALETTAPPRYPKISTPPGQMTLHGPWGPAEAGEATH